MTYRGHVKNGQVALDEPVALPEGAPVNIEVVEQKVRISEPPVRAKLRKFEPIRMPGGPLADDIVRDRR